MSQKQNRDPHGQSEKAVSPGTGHFCMDKGYDAADVYRKALALGASAVIPLNLRNEKIPPEGLNKGHAPVCSMGYDMVYWGCDRKTGVLKFHCPHVLGKADCPQGSNWCSGSNYGCAVKKRTEDDPRSFCLPHRGSREWERIYKLRSSAERLFSRTKAAMGLDDIHLRGIAKVTAHSLLCGITVLASAIAMHWHFQKQYSGRREKSVLFSVWMACSDAFVSRIEICSDFCEKYVPVDNLLKYFAKPSFIVTKRFMRLPLFRMACSVRNYREQIALVPIFRAAARSIPHPRGSAATPAA